MKAKIPETTEDYIILVIEGLAIFILSATGEFLGRAGYELGRPWLKRNVFPFIRKICGKVLYFMGFKKFRYVIVRIDIETYEQEKNSNPILKQLENKIKQENGNTYTNT